MFLKRIGFQGKGLPTPRRSRGVGKVTRSRINRYLFESASVVSPVDPVGPAPATPATAEFLARGGGEGLTFTSVDGNGDGYRVGVFKSTTYQGFGFVTNYLIIVFEPNGYQIYYGGGQTSLAGATNAAQNAAALSGILEVTLASGVTEVVYSNSAGANDATIVGEETEELQTGGGAPE